MSTSPSSAATLVRILLDTLHPAAGRPTPSDAMADKAMAHFLADLAGLDQKHNRGKSLSQDQLAEQIFRCSPTFDDDRGLTGYLRYQLRVALVELSRLDSEMRNQSNGSITLAVLTQYSRIILDYLFDLREIFTFLQRNVPGWTFFQGGKNSGVTSWEVYILAHRLALQSTYIGTGPPFDHKTAQIASIFVL